MESRAQFLKGVARTLVLGLLRERPMYGYAIATALAARSEGVFALGQGTLYPLLYSLERKGLIRVSREEEAPGAGRRRCYYMLTPAGKAELEANLVTWGEMARGMELVLGGREGRGAKYA